MSKIVSVGFVFLSMHLLAVCSACLVAAADKPNIIIFLADDLGYADIGVNGCKDIPTPNVGAIANGGVRFTDGYPQPGVFNAMDADKDGFATHAEV